MPELPEVETVRRTLQYQMGHPLITKVEVYWERIVADMCKHDFCELIAHQRICDYERIGKYLIFVLEDYYLVSHLRMEGKYFVQQKQEPYDPKHTHVIFQLEDGRQLRYHDTRKFGRMYLYPKHVELTAQKAFAHVGFDVFDEHLDAAYLYQQLHSRHIVLKQALLDQSVMAGIGNIYADEICFALGYHPETKIAHLRKKEYPLLLETVRSILRKAIDCGGTTIRSYTSSLGVDGRFQLELAVHAQKGKACPRCGNEIVKKVVATRGTYYCPHCQRKRSSKRLINHVSTCDL